MSYRAQFLANLDSATRGSNTHFRAVRTLRANCFRLQRVTRHTLIIHFFSSVIALDISSTSRFNNLRIGVYGKENEQKTASGRLRSANRGAGRRRANPALRHSTSSQNGLASARLDDVAERRERGEGDDLYFYFKDKEALLQELLAR